MSELRYQYDDIRKQMEAALEDENMPKRLNMIMENIIHMINAILKTSGNGWAAQAVDGEGKQILDKEEQQQFTEAFEPYIESIIQFFGKKMRGGKFTSVNWKEGTINESENSSKFTEGLHTTNKLKVIEIEKEREKKNAKEKKEKPVELTPPFTGPIQKEKEEEEKEKEEEEKEGKPIKFEATLFQKMAQQVDSSTKILEESKKLEDTLNKTFGNDILRLQGKIYGFGDSSPIPRIGSLIPFAELTKIISPRLLRFIAYLFLDITRLGMNSAGNVSGRKMMSILLAVLDVLRDGDYKWQKAFLTLIGYAGSNQLLVGELLKVFLTIFEKLNPTYQRNVIDNIPCILKSIIAGCILEIVRVTATENVGTALDVFFDKIENEKIRQNKVADSVDIGPRPSSLVPTFRDINNLQVVMADKAYLNSCDVREAIRQVNNENSAPIKFLFFIFGIPTDSSKLDQCTEYPESVTTEMKDNPVSDNENDNEKKRMRAKTYELKAPYRNEGVPQIVPQKGIAANNSWEEDNAQRKEDNANTSESKAPYRNEGVPQIVPQKGKTGKNSWEEDNAQRASKHNVT